MKMTYDKRKKIVTNKDKELRWKIEFKNLIETRHYLTRPDTRHKSFAVFVSARRKESVTDRRTDGHTLL